MNQGSFAPPASLGYGIAQGAMFALFGAEMGPASLVVASQFPLTPELAGTSVQVKVGGETLDCIMVFTSAGQLAAILPSATPLGDGEITVTYNGETSTPQPIRVVANGVGMFTIPQNGRGPAVVTDANFAVNTYLNSFAPGGVAIAWVTGLGARQADDRAVPEDLKERYNVEVGVGGVSANVLYAGPSGCCAGVDQIVYEIPLLPQDVRTGCHVPLVIRAGGTLSNFTSMSVSSDGAVCGDEHGFSAAEVAFLHEHGELRLATATATAYSSSVGPALGVGAAAALSSDREQNAADVFVTDANGRRILLETFSGASPPARGTCGLLSESGEALPLDELVARVEAFRNGESLGALEGPLGDSFFFATDAQADELAFGTIAPRIALSYDVRGDGEYAFSSSYGTYVAALDAGVTRGAWDQIDALANQDPPSESLNFRFLPSYDVGGRIQRSQFFCADSAPDHFLQDLFRQYPAPIAVETSTWASRTHDKLALPDGAGADFLFLNIQRRGDILYFAEPGPTVETSAVSEARQDGQFLSIAANFNNVGVSYAARYVWNGPEEGNLGIFVDGNETPIFELPLLPGVEGAAGGSLPVHQWLEGGPSPAAVMNGIANGRVEARTFVKEIAGPRQFRFGAPFRLR